VAAQDKSEPEARNHFVEQWAAGVQCEENSQGAQPRMDVASENLVRPRSYWHGHPEFST
jgi:hypothetical protein